MVRPKDRRAEALYLVKKYETTKARCCRLLGLSLSTLAYEAAPSTDGPIRDKLISLVGENKRFGHPRLFVLLKREMPEVNHKRDLAGLNWSRFNVSLGPKVGDPNGTKKILG